MTEESLKKMLGDMEITEQYGSKASSNIYHIVAKNGDAKLGMSLMHTVVPLKGKPAHALVLRFLEIPDPKNPTNVAFKHFAKRHVSDYFRRAADNEDVLAFRAEKLILPLCEMPISGYEFNKLLEENDVFGQLAGFVKERVAADGGTMVVSDDTLLMVMTYFLQAIPTNKPAYLFQLPALQENPPSDEGDEHGDDE
jgi:hypothetical protein